MRRLTYARLLRSPSLSLFHPSKLARFSLSLSLKHQNYNRPRPPQLPLCWFSFTRHSYSANTGNANRGNNVRGRGEMLAQGRCCVGPKVIPQFRSVLASSQQRLPILSSENASRLPTSSPAIVQSNGLQQADKVAMDSLWKFREQRRPRRRGESPSRGS